MTGVERIAAERRWQIGAEGWTPEHDDGHRHGELAVSAAELAVAHTDARVEHPDGDGDAWGLVAKHGRDEVRALAIAGALIAAEIDRIQRAEKKAVPAGRPASWPPPSAHGDVMSPDWFEATG